MIIGHASLYTEKNLSNDNKMGSLLRLEGSEPKANTNENKRNTAGGPVWPWKNENAFGIQNFTIRVYVNVNTR